jgi:regulatory protein
MKSTQEVLWNYSLRVLTRRPRTVQELQEKLKNHTAYEATAASAVVQKLSDLNYLNDRDFVARTIEQYSKLKPTGLRGLQSRLSQKGISPSLVKELFESSEVDESKLALEALKKATAKWERLPDPQRRNKQLNFLARRGFRPSIVFQLVKQFNSGYDSANNS